MIRGLIDAAFGLIVRHRRRVAVGAGARVRWHRLGFGRGGTLTIGSHSIVRCRVDFDRTEARVTIGDRCYIGASHLVCHTEITLEDDVIVSWGVTIVDHDSHALDWNHRRRDVDDWAVGRKDWTHVAVAPVRLCRRVWVGFGASVLKGVTVGEGAVIGAGALVTRNVPPYTVVAGNPARVVRRLVAPAAEMAR